MREPPATPPDPPPQELVKGEWLDGGRTIGWCGWRVRIPPAWKFLFDGPSIYDQSELIAETPDTKVSFYLEDPPPNWNWKDLLADDRAIRGQVVECTKNGQSLYGVYFPPRKNGYFFLHFQRTSNGDAETVSRAGTISGTRLPTEEEKADLSDLLFGVEVERSPGKNPKPGPGGPGNEPLQELGGKT